MAIYPGADHYGAPKPGLLRRIASAVKARVLLLPESSTQPRIRPRLVILHSAAGHGSLYRFFLRSSSLESHFWISTSGVVEQYVDTEVRADANYLANNIAVSIETESSVRATEPWPPAQFEAIIAVVVWLCRTHGIPGIRATAWDGTGIGWHIMWGAPGKWTPVSKSCPGPARIRQMPAVIAEVNRRLGGAAPTPTPSPTPVPDPEELVMDQEARLAFKALNDKIDNLRGDVWVTNDNVDRRYGSLRGWLAATARKLGVSRDAAAAEDTYVNKSNP